MVFRSAGAEKGVVDERKTVKGTARAVTVRACGLLSAFKSMRAVCLEWQVSPGRSAKAPALNANRRYFYKAPAVNANPVRSAQAPPLNAFSATMFARCKHLKVISIAE